MFTKIKIQNSFGCKNSVTNLHSSRVEFLVNMKPEFIIDNFVEHGYSFKEEVLAYFALDYNNRSVDRPSDQCKRDNGYRRKKRVIMEKKIINFQTS